MTAYKRFHTGRAEAQDTNTSIEPWQRTPRWMFWRPAWRRRKRGVADVGWVYQTHRHRARQLLHERFGK
jgi:hypothetical protein